MDGSPAIVAAIPSTNARAERRIEPFLHSTRQLKRFRIACLVGMLLGLFILFAMFMIQPGGSIQDRMAGSVAAILTHSLVFFWITHMMRLRWPAWFILLGMIGVALSLAGILIYVWKPPYYRGHVGTNAQLMVLNSTLAFVHFIALIPTALAFRSKTLPVLRSACAGLLLVSFALFVYNIWATSAPDQPWWLPWTVFVGALAAAHTLLVLPIGAGLPAKLLKVTKIIAITIGILAASGIIAMIIAAPDWSEEWTLRAGATAICAVVTATIAHGALVMQARKSRARSECSTWPYVFDFRCPGCQTSFTASTAGCQCPMCSLAVTVKLHPSACLNCGYEMKGLTKSECPECGAAY